MTPDDPKETRRVDRIDIDKRAVDRIATPQSEHLASEPAVQAPLAVMPLSVRRLEKLLLIAAAVSMMGMVISLNQSVHEVRKTSPGVGTGMVVLMQGGFIAISLAIGFAATRRISMWARRLMKFTAVLMLINPVMNAITILSRPAMVPFAIFFSAVGAAILYLCSRPDAKTWFARPAIAGDGTQSVKTILVGEIKKHF